MTTASSTISMTQSHIAPDGTSGGGHHFQQQEKTLILRYARANRYPLRVNGVTGADGQERNP